MASKIFFLLKLLNVKLNRHLKIGATKNVKFERKYDERDSAIYRKAEEINIAEKSAKKIHHYSHTYVYIAKSNFVFLANETI